MHNYMLITVSGADRGGIVHDVAAAMTNLDINIEDSSMTALRGEFTIMMIVRLPDSLAVSAIKATLAELEQRTGLVAQSRLLDEKQVAHPTNEPNCVVTVSGGDRPGIVQAVTAIIADQQGLVVDLSTSTIERNDDNLYMMALEITIEDIPTLKQHLQQVAASLHIDIDVIGMEEGLI
ncbi:MAG: ACT domain-containing protein [Mariprofundales bacterium]